MVLFPAYAVLVWYFAFKWRRSWLAFAAVVLGVAFVGVLAWFHRTLNFVLGGIFEGPIFPMMLAAEAVFVGMVGVFIASLPLEVAQVPCRGCKYDLAGLEDANPTCPECGMAHAAIKVKQRHCRVCRAEFFVTRHENPPCPKCGVDHAVRALKPEKPARRIVVPMVQSFWRAVGVWGIQPRTMRKSMPSSSTASGTPTIMVIRRPDNTFTSIG